MIAEVVWEYDTVVWRQRLERTGDRFYLRRTYRDEGPWPDHPADALRAVKGPSVAPVVPAEGRRGSYTFELACGNQLAGQLWPVVAPVVLAGFGAFHRLGVLLARLHRLALPRDLPETSPHLRRLRAYLDDPTPNVTEQALGTLQPVTVSTLRQVLDVLAATSTPVLCHGGFSVGSVLTDPKHQQLEVVSGPELCRGPRELDLGWMIGELTEYELAAVRAGSGTEFYSRAAAVLLTAYTDEAEVPIDQSLIDGVVAARVALHRLDYVSTTGHPEQTTASTFIDWLTERWRHHGHEGETT